PLIAHAIVPNLTDGAAPRHAIGCRSERSRSPRGERPGARSRGPSLQIALPEGDLRRSHDRRMGPADHPLPARAPALPPADPRRADSSRARMVAESPRLHLPELREAPV